MEKKSIVFLLNGKEICLEAEPHRSLLDILRDDLGMTGTKCGCNEGECGTCSVLLNGNLVTSCLVQAGDLQGQSVLTIEGLEEGGEPHIIQKAFVAYGAIQCGYCTPSMIMAAKALLDRNPHPTRDEIRFAISGNICRCTGYDKIILAIESLARGDVFEENDGVWLAESTEGAKPTKELETACGCAHGNG